MVLVAGVMTLCACAESAPGGDGPQVVASGYVENLPPPCFSNPIELLGETRYGIPSDDVGDLASTHPLPAADDDPDESDAGGVPEPEASMVIAGQPSTRGTVTHFDDGIARFDAATGHTTWYTTEETFISEAC